MPGIDYRMAQVDEKLGAAISNVEKTQGYPNVYFDTDDIDATMAKVRDLGGQCEDKMPVPSMGWFCLCKDTEGTPSGSGRPIRPPGCSARRTNSFSYAASAGSSATDVCFRRGSATAASVATARIAAPA